MRKILIILLFLQSHAFAGVDKDSILQHVQAAAKPSLTQAAPVAGQQPAAVAPVPGRQPAGGAPAVGQQPAGAPPAGPKIVVADPMRDDRLKRLDEERVAALVLRSTCDGRFNVLRFDLQRSISRSEKISIAGGLFGVFGAIATCPHCAAIGAGIAGLANPLQQTFKDNGDAPEHHRAKLTALSETINDELIAYRNLPPADPDNEDFEKNLRARLDALLLATASCQYYEQAFEAASSNTSKEK